MQYFFKIAFDSIFPPSDEVLLVRDTTETDLRRCYFSHYFNSVLALSQYQDKTIRALIHEAKFHHNTHAWSLLNSLFMIQMHKISTPIDYIIPVPLSPARLRTRGYNQVSEILKAESLHTSHNILTDVLIRTRNTQPQTELARKERLLNLHDAFGVVQGECIRDKHILLIDDVTTTGTTLLTAKATLLSYSPASITCIALAH